jgi:hypothetical protein
MRRLVPFVVVWLLAGPGEAPAQLVHFDASQLELVREPVTPIIAGPIDQRFFGTFCQPQPKEFCKSIPILPDPCVTLRDTFVRMDHLTMRNGGFVRGAGRFVLDGKQGRLAVAGSIVSRGRARIAAAAPGLGEQRGEGTLSFDGLQLTASVQGRSVVLRKDACGNSAPLVTLTAPFGPTFPFGQSIMLAGHITDEDTDFPVERLVFTSNRQGLLRGTRVAGGRTLFTTSLQPGNHHVTFTVTDSGGLTRQASIDLTVVNRPPDTPHIFLPVANATLITGAPVLLQGTAFDPESGVLSGAALAWSAQLTPGGPFLPLGNGSELGTVFAAPADPVRLRLTATDGTGQSSQAEQQVRVVASTGNAPPVVVIQEPDRRLSPAPYAATFIAGQASHLLAAASDVEDAGPGLQLRWEFAALRGPGGVPDPNPPVTNPAPVTGTMATDVVFPIVTVGPSLFYRITFTATDSGGASSSDTIEVFVSSAGVIL